MRETLATTIHPRPALTVEVPQATARQLGRIPKDQTSSTATAAPGPTSSRGGRATARQLGCVPKDQTSSTATAAPDSRARGADEPQLGG